ncbi:UDP-sugar hydrolase, putative [Ixodes scapularis]|uniref:5'-nucleotidase n=1 Tax=Ixodes scapularis TaxID=6945 RepID=B7PW54_IXOSC|nr:UDP-sugar hydrolase, putative [Ixodes scapularis]|eukprot:XP_002409309.1 UDP-sugar hydrolase, putative [Ixodes scapularis]
MQVHAVRTKFSNVLFLNAGGWFQGSALFSTLTINNYSKIIASAKYDAMGLGHHDFDRGPLELKTYLNHLKEKKIVVLCCNVDMQKERHLNDTHIAPSVVLKRNGTQIGIIGYISPSTQFRSYTGHTQFTNDLECVRREAKRLRRKGVRILIALGNSGLTEDKRIATHVPEVGVVVGGFSHSFLFSTALLQNTPDTADGPYPVVIQRADGSQGLVVQAYWQGKYVGVLHATFDSDGNVIRYSGQPVLMDKAISKALPRGHQLEQLLSSISADAYKDRNRVVGSTKVLLEGSRQVCRLTECTMGNLMADAMFYWFAGLSPLNDKLWGPVNGALIPGRDIFTSIDYDITQGIILMKHLFEVLGGEHLLIYSYTVEMNGAHLYELFERSVQRYAPDANVPLQEFLQVSGFRVVYNVKNPPMHRVQTLKALCTNCRIPKYIDVERAQRYTVVIPDTMLRGSEREVFSRIPPSDIVKTGVVLSTMHI